MQYTDMHAGKIFKYVNKFKWKLKPDNNETHGPVPAAITPHELRLIHRTCMGGWKRDLTPISLFSSLHMCCGTKICVCMRVHMYKSSTKLTETFNAVL